MALQPICINTTSQCGSGSPLPPCVGNCGGSGGDCECWVPWDIESAYSVNDVVIYNDQLYIANGDIPPGTPFTIGTTGATWRAISVGTTTIVPFDDTRSYSQYEAVSYDGKLYVANTALLPGPFNPVDWTEISSDGVISTQDTDAIQMTGNGTALDPLIATLLLDGAANNLLQITTDGLYLDPADIPSSETVVDISNGVTWWVDAVTGDDTTGDGLMTSPFATVTHAMGAASSGDVINVMPGTYTGENVVWKSNVMVQGYATQDSALTILQGDFLVGTGITRARAKDLQLRGTGVNPTLVFNASAGRHYFDNVTISNTGSVESVRFTGNNQRWYVFRAGSINNALIIDDPAQANAIDVYIESGAEAPDLTISADNATVYLTDRIAIGDISHNAGKLYLRGVGTIASLTSAADLPGALVVQASSLRQPDGTFGSFTKTGNASFWFNAFSRDPLADESAFGGTKNLIELASDIHGQINPVNYINATPALTDHLVGIDNKLGDIALGKTVAIDFGLDFGSQWLAGEVAISHVLRDVTTFEVPDPTTVVFKSSDPIDGVIRVVVSPFDGSPSYDLITVEIVNGLIDNLSGVVATLAVNDTLLFITDNAATFSYAALTVTGYRVIDYT